MITSMMRGALLCALLGGTAAAEELVVPGTGDGMDMLAAVGTAFTADHPAIAVRVPPSVGSGGAVAAVGTDRAVLGRIARPLSESESATGLRAAPLVKIASVFLVHPAAGVKALTSPQVAAIYAGQVENWSEVGGADLKIKVVRREEVDSTLTVLRATMPGWRDLAITTRSKLAVTTQDAIDTVKRVPGAIAFAPYAAGLQPDVAVLSIDGLKPHDACYPSAVTVSLLYRDETVTPEARAFLDFAGSPKARTLMAGMGGVPVAH